ncbi:hypothetical protein LT679_01840 [Mucilaginibacter roseus]|uniref:Uncharacterized protein n=1 Tax=Mucilaginibacter roseus TaxID=1528868 RepID=A0ABS8TWS2_9SPHI|nr:hypothetical protein [Mucilaginibacter roseus]MCD8739330.1 hypothetical protein [Mucilaginibacter roseus]
MLESTSDCYIDNAGRITSNAPKIYGQDRFAENKMLGRFDMGDLSYQELYVPGIQIIYGDWRFRNLAATDVQKEGEFVEMHFTLSGTGEVCDSLSGNVYHFQENKQSLFFISSLSGRSQFQTPEFRFFELRLSPEYFLEICKRQLCTYSFI